MELYLTIIIGSLCICYPTTRLFVFVIQLPSCIVSCTDTFKLYV